MENEIILTQRYLQKAQKSWYCCLSHRVKLKWFGSSIKTRLIFKTKSIKLFFPSIRQVQTCIRWEIHFQAVTKAFLLLRLCTRWHRLPDYSRIYCSARFMPSFRYFASWKCQENNLHLALRRVLHKILSKLERFHPFRRYDLARVPAVPSFALIRAYFLHRRIEEITQYRVSISEISFGTKQLGEIRLNTNYTSANVQRRFTSFSGISFVEIQNNLPSYNENIYPTLVSAECRLGRGH